ncbi:MAG: NADH-quinone oxidoreductase subunit I [Deltaproteobacteria bacterium]|nr:NADH-quinone oxidoreductase subunit I [Deltaproteobacteria bacterium]
MEAQKQEYHPEPFSTGYFADIWNTAKSLFYGMSNTMSHLFRAPSTVQYPEVDVKATLPDRYRGFLTVDMDVCISCRNCEKACPIDCIWIEDVKLDRVDIIGNNGKPSKKMLYPVVFNIDLGKCMYCGLCTEPCPTDAIHFTKEFERATTDFHNLYFEFVSPEERKEVLAKREKFEAKEAEAKAKKAAAAAAAAAAKPAETATPATPPTEPPKS